MSSQEAFGVIVRAVGLGLVIHGVGRVLSEAMMGMYGSPGFWLHAVLTIGVGLWMLRGGKGLVEWAYKGATT